MRSRLALFLFAAILVPAYSQAAENLAGQWNGRYTCLQGQTALSLTINAEETSDHYSALFHFKALPKNPAVPEGCFTMEGLYYPETRQFIFVPQKWIVKPFGYVSVGLNGILDESGQSYAGNITGGFNCSTFELSRSTLVTKASGPCDQTPEISLFPGFMNAAFNF